jgi:predicted TIM-barrel fold metal-dependent hydrolase
MFAASTLPPSFALAQKGKVLDGHMHLESYGTYWEGLDKEVIEHFDYAGIDQGVVFTAWTPSRESNDRTLRARQKYADRFIPFGHIRTEDPDWENELERIGRLGWKGIKLHQNEISRRPDLEEKIHLVVRRASDCGASIILIHLEDVDMVDRLAGKIQEVTWIIPHMGCYKSPEEMKSYRDLAKKRANVFLDTSGSV